MTIPILFSLDRVKLAKGHDVKRNEKLERLSLRLVPGVDYTTSIE